ncbi:MAG: 2'-5' RNA ligase family protein [Candidatus Peregrinibacteria bacterium]|nr:2'-5' RNA ligase family protein [Candidatus Peregrinibacteria bacterium]
MNYQKQIERFQKLFEENFSMFGTKVWEEDPNFLYFIYIPLPEVFYEDAGNVMKKIQSAGELKDAFWVSPWNLHITLALPGRLGQHFQGNEVPFMERVLGEICAEMPKFSIQLANLNCFPNCVYREVLDESGNLYELHNKITEKIPFSQHPEYEGENFVPHMSFFYGGKDSENIFTEDFDRELPLIEIPVNKILFGKARDKEGKYQREILKEFLLQ